ncbi:hypothetical protein EON65_21690 [archaeon]|nr:MAG: hypothetical protein EON65_21690 [archaeon]
MNLVEMNADLAGRFFHLLKGDKLTNQECTTRQVEAIKARQRREQEIRGKASLLVPKFRGQARPRIF